MRARQGILFGNNVSKVFFFARDRNAPIDEFFIGFHSCLESITFLSLDERLKGYTLFRQARLSFHDPNVVIGSGESRYSLQAVSTARWKAARSKEMPGTSMATSRLMLHRFTCRTFEKYSVRHMSSSAPFSYKADANEPLLFYSFLSKEKLHKKASAAIYSGASVSAVDKTTFDAALRALRALELKDESVCQK